MEQFKPTPTAKDPFSGLVRQFLTMPGTSQKEDFVIPLDRAALLRSQELTNEQIRSSDDG